MWWEVLGIENDATLREVKGAYAKRIKNAYQSGNQEEIMKIQNAYKSASEYIKSQNEEPKVGFRPSSQKINNTPVFNFEDHESNKHIKKSDHEDLDYEYVEESEFNNIDDIQFREDEEITLHLEKWAEFFDPIYTDMTKRFNIEEWKNLFYDFSFKEEEYFQEHGYKYFNEHYQLPHDIWLVIDENLKLISNRLFIWKDKIKFDDNLEYYPYEGYSYEELEKLFILRSEACEAYMNCDFDNCLNICEEANKINSKEAVIIKLKGLCHFDLGNYKLSYCSFQELQSYDKHKVEAKRYMADIHFKNKDFKKANDLYEEIYKENNDILKSRSDINCSKVQDNRLKTILKYKIHKFGQSCGEFLEYEFTPIIEKYLLKKNYFTINALYRLSRSLIRLGVCLALIFKVLGGFWKLILGIIVIYLIIKIIKGGK